LKNSPVPAPAAVEKITRAEAIEKITKHAAEVRAQLEVSQAQMKAAVSPDKYALHFQVDAFKKKLHFCKAQIARIKKDPQSAMVWPDSFGI